MSAAHDRDYEHAITRRSVLGYLVENPEANDTLEGITGWWVMEESLKRAETVKQVLAELVTEDLVLERTASDGRPHYRVNRERLDEIRNLLGRTSRQAP